MAKSSLQAPKWSGLKKGRWTIQEDHKLIRYMEGTKKHDKETCLAFGKPPYTL